MIKAYHNCTLEDAELIKTDGMIRSNAALQHRGIDRCRITGLSTEDTRFCVPVSRMFPAFRKTKHLPTK